MFCLNLKLNFFFRPLYSFEDNGDYVYDVAWSPIHPGTIQFTIYKRNFEIFVELASLFCHL